VDQAKSQEFDRLLARAESRVQELELLADPEARARAADALQALLKLHGDVLERMLEAIGSWRESPQALLDYFGTDEVISGLLILHGLHPRSLRERVDQALQRVSPYLGSHGGSVEVVALEDGVLRLRLQGSCDGCPSSALTLQQTIERELLVTAPDLAAIAVEGMAPATGHADGFIPVMEIKPMSRKPRAGGSHWQTVTGLDGLRPDSPLVREVNGGRLIFYELRNNRYAYRDQCPSCQESLARAQLDEEILTCLGCGARYDIWHAGRPVDESGAPLEPIPLLVESGSVKVALA
jgi:Fe-S cluster biogenesis protein NfuA/nitrite reductase/ring-hydroxylating ferredoxin subunit